MITPKTYEEISLSSIPQSDDQIKANPSDPWLEMYIVESQKKKKSRGRTIHINSVLFESEKPNNVLIDDQLYGPFTKVKITPYYVSDSENIKKFPLMVFGPILKK